MAETSMPHRITPESPYLTIRMLAGRLGVTEKTVRKWIREFGLGEAMGVYRVPGAGGRGAYRIDGEMFEREFVQKAGWKGPNG